MSRYIDIDDISLRKTIACGGLSAKALWRRIQQQPTIDAVSVVRCGECKLGGTEDCPMDEIDDEYFCNFGERSDT